MNYYDQQKMIRVFFIIKIFLKITYFLYKISTRYILLDILFHLKYMVNIFQNLKFRK